MVKKITIGMVFLMLVSASIYSQTVETNSFIFLKENMSAELFTELRNQDFSRDGFRLVERLSNSVVNEINRQLTDYHPLNNGQAFIWQGALINSVVSVSGQIYLVTLRITDTRNSQWEYVAYVKYISK